MDVVGIALTGGLAVIGGVVWLVRLEGRVNTHEAECAQRQQRMDERHVETNKKLDAIDAKLDRLVEGQ